MYVYIRIYICTSDIYISLVHIYTYIWGGSAPAKTKADRLAVDCL